jgi:rfaE bifunctional protein kinase chain/domain
LTGSFPCQFTSGLMKSMLKDAIQTFPKKRLAVIGDIMLDIWEYGQISRQSPEAPIPVVQMESKSVMLGGAANAALNGATCGASIQLFGVVGADVAAQEVRSLLQANGIHHGAVLVDPARPTTQKQRIVGPNGHLLRVDYERRTAIPEELAQDILVRFDSCIAEFDAVVISDYAKGVMTMNLATQIISHAEKAGVPVVVDTKPHQAHFYKGATVLTPNLKEAYEIAGSEDLLVAGAKLVELFGAVIVTRGADGMTYFGNGAPLHIAAANAVVEDVSGAGDTATMGVALGLAAGLTLADAALLANVMASLVVSKKGTASVTRAEILESIANG